MFKSFFGYNNNTNKVSVENDNTNEVTDENIPIVDLMESFHTIEEENVDDLMDYMDDLIDQFHTVSEYEPTDCIPGVPLTRKGELTLRKGGDFRTTISCNYDYRSTF